MKPDIITDYYLGLVENKKATKRTYFFILTWAIYLLSITLFGQYFYLFDKLSYGVGVYIIMVFPLIIQYMYGKYLNHRYE
jgi:hypothetical protein